MHSSIRSSLQYHLNQLDIFLRILRRSFGCPAPYNAIIPFPKLNGIRVLVRRPHLPILIPRRPIRLIYPLPNGQHRRQALHKRSIIFHPDDLLLGVDLNMSVEDGYIVESRLVDDEELAVVERCRPVVLLEATADDLLRHTEDFSHCAQIVSSEETEQIQEFGV